MQFSPRPPYRGFCVCVYLYGLRYSLRGLTQLKIFRLLFFQSDRVTMRNVLLVKIRQTLPILSVAVRELPCAKSSKKDGHLECHSPEKKKQKNYSSVFGLFISDNLLLLSHQLFCQNLIFVILYDWINKFVFAVSRYFK